MAVDWLNGRPPCRSSCPISTDGLKTGQRSNRRRVGAQYARPKRKFQTILTAAIMGPFSRRKIRLPGPISTAALPIGAAALNHCDGIGIRIIRAGLVAEQQRPVVTTWRPAPLTSGTKAITSGISRRSVCSAASMALASIRSSFTRVTCVVGAYWPDAAAPHFRGLLCNEIESCLFHRRKDQPQVGAGLPDHGSVAAAPAGIRLPSRCSAACHSPSRPLNSATASPSPSRITFNR